MNYNIMGSQPVCDSHLFAQEPPLPEHKCLVTGEPIYKGVRIGGEEHFAIDVYESYSWVQWYKDNCGLSDREIYDLPVVFFSDDGFVCTLKK